MEKEEFEKPRKSLQKDAHQIRQIEDKLIKMKDLMVKSDPRRLKTIKGGLNYCQGYDFKMGVSH